MTIVSEDIPDNDVISRIIQSPIHFQQELIWLAVFVFPKSECESTVWRKYAPSNDDVHTIGQKMVAEKLETRADRQYKGFVSAEVGKIRKIRTMRGHAFSVEHSPSEGIHHAEVCIVPSSSQDLKKNDKVELRQALEYHFSDIVAPSN